MHFEGEFRVPGKADEVIHRFADIPRMAGCVPGTVLQPQAEDGSWPGAMVVSFGPKKISFKGRVACEFDFAARTGALHGRGAADLRAARIGVKVAFALRDDASATQPTTIVRVTSDAELGGVLADFARTGGVAVANVLMQDFARRASEEFARDAPPQTATTAATPDAAAATDVLAAGMSATTDEPAAGTSPAVDAPAVTASAAPIASPHAASVHETTSPGTRGAATPATHAPTAPPARPPAAPATLSAHGLLWAVIKHKLRRLAGWLGFGAKDV